MMQPEMCHVQPGTIQYDACHAKDAERIKALDAKVAWLEHELAKALNAAGVSETQRLADAFAEVAELRAALSTPSEEA